MLVMRSEREAEAKGEQESSRSLSPEQGARACKKPGTSIQGLCQHLTGPCLHTYTHVCTLCAAACAKALDVQARLVPMHMWARACSNIHLCAASHRHARTADTARVHCMQVCLAIHACQDVCA